MDCLAENDVLDFVRGTSDETKRAALISHLDVCPSCRQFFSLVATTSLSRPAWPKSQVDVPSTTSTSGRYLVLGVCGAGASSVVYKAYDPQLQRDVALKILEGARTAASSSALLDEARAMARVSHPNVVAVHDAGLLGDELFISMELVDGPSLDLFLREQKPSWRKILSLFVEAGQGLAAAHRAGVVHRDFKPHNVLVAKSGRVCVTDFGLARRAARLGAASAMSAMGEREVEAKPIIVGTPAYMAPEQLQAGHADARSDLFSFSVALYEALYGSRPYAWQREPLASIDSDAELRPPKETSTPAWVWRALKKGLAKDPSARPASIDSFLEELDPVRRRRRNQLRGVVLGGMLLVGACVFALGTRPVRVCAEDSLAERMAALEPNLREALARDATTARLLPLVLGKFDEAAQALKRTAQTSCRAWQGGSETDLLYDTRRLCLHRHESEILAWMMALQRDPAQTSRVLDEAALSDPEACAESETLLTVEAPPSDPSLREALNRQQEALAELRTLATTGQYAAGHDKAAALATDQAAAPYRPAQAEALYWDGFFLERLRDLAPAEERLRRAAVLALASRHYEVAARAWLGLSHLYLEQKDASAAAEGWAEQAEGLVQGLSLPAVEPALFKLLGNLRRHQARYPEALAHYERALALQRARFGSDSPQLANTLNNLGRAYLLVGRYDDSEQALREALRLQLLMGDVHPDLGVILNNLGNALKEQGRAKEALQYYRDSVAMYRAAYPPTHAEQLVPLLNQAVVLNEAGEFDEALPIFREVLRHPGATNENRAQAYHNMGVLFARTGRDAECLAAYHSALAIREKLYGSDHPQTAFSIFNVGCAEERRGDTSQAFALYDRALAVFSTAIGPTSAPAGMVLVAKGDLQRKLGRSHAALATLTEAQRVQERALGERHVSLGETLTLVGKTLMALRRFDEAFSALTKAREIRMQGPSNPTEKADTLFALAQVCAEREGCTQRVRELAHEAMTHAEQSKGAEPPHPSEIATWLHERGEGCE